MKNLLTFFFILSSAFSLSAQHEETVFNKYGGVNLTGFWASSYNAMADFNDDYNLSNGGSITFEFNKDFLVGWTSYKSDITGSGQDIELTGNDLFLGYTYNSHKVIHPLFYLQGGSGKLKIEDVGSDRVFVVQPTIGAEVNITRWFRLGIDGGYRFFSGSNLSDISNSDLSSPTLGIRLKFGWSWGSHHQD